MRAKILVLAAIATVAVLPLSAMADTVGLGTAGGFSVLGGSTVTNTGTSVIDGGDVGVSAGSAITGFPPGTIAAPYTTHAADAVAAQAQADLTTAYDTAAGLAPTQTLTGSDLGGLTLAPGVYFFADAAGLTGALTLDDTGGAGGLWVFQIGSSLTTATSSSVVMLSGASPAGCNVFWQVGSSATLGTTTAFMGHILAYQSITLNTGATILNGSALARNGAVTLDTNTITNSVCSGGATVVPLPGSAAMGLAGLAMLSLVMLARRRRSATSFAV